MVFPSEPIFQRISAAIIPEGFTIFSVELPHCL